MNNLYLIVKNVSDPERNSLLERRLGEYGAWAKITNDVWVILSPIDSAIDIRSNLQVVLGNGDTLFVMTYKNPSWASFGLPVEVAEWLKCQSK